LTSNIFEQNNSSKTDLSPPFSLPLTTSLLITESLFPNPFSPTTSLIIPLVKIKIPYAYFVVVALDLITAFLLKWYYGPTYSLLAPQYISALPDTEMLRQIYEDSAKQQAAQQSAEQQASLGSPLLPVGMAINISFSSPFSEPNSRFATLFTVELKEIRNIPGYLLPLAALLLYIILRPFFLNSRNNNRKQDAQ